MSIEKKYTQEEIRTKVEESIRRAKETLAAGHTPEEIIRENKELTPDELKAVAGGDKKNVNQQKFIQKGVRKVQEEESEHCNNDFNAPLHIWIPTGHEERPVLWGIFGNYTKGYNLYKCSLCGATKEERV